MNSRHFSDLDFSQLAVYDTGYVRKDLLIGDPLGRSDFVLQDGWYPAQSLKEES